MIRKVTALKELIDLLEHRRSFILPDNRFNTMVTYFKGFLDGLDSFDEEYIGVLLKEYGESQFKEHFSVSWYDYLYYSKNENDEEACKYFFKVIKDFLEEKSLV